MPLERSVGLYVMTEKGEAVTHAALASGRPIAHVTTAPAAGMNDDAHERIATICKRTDVPVFLRQPPPEYANAAAVSVAAGWRWMLNLDHPLVVLHDSLLPRYRGFSPLITALVNGDPQVGVTAFLAEPEPDTGPIIGQRSIPVAYPARMREILDRLTPLYGQLATDVLGQEQLRYTAQDHRQATWSLWRDDHDYRIDWTSDDRRVCRLVDAASDPFPGAWTTIVPGARTTTDSEAIVRVLAAEPVPDRRYEDRHAGKVAYHDTDGFLVVVCGTGLVKLTDVRHHNGEPARLSLKTRFR